MHRPERETERERVLSFSLYYSIDWVGRFGCARNAPTARSSAASFLWWWFDWEHKCPQKFFFGSSTYIRTPPPSDGLSVCLSRMAPAGCFSLPHDHDYDHEWCLSDCSFLFCVCFFCLVLEQNAFIYRAGHALSLLVGLLLVVYLNNLG